MLTLKDFNTEDLVFVKMVTKRKPYKRQYWYRIKGGDDAVCISETLNKRNEMSIIKGYFKTKIDYGLRCQEKARILNLPIEVVLAVGYNHADELPRFLKVNNIDEIKHELVNTGIERRKRMLKNLLGTLYLTFNIDDMGQLNSRRLANYISSICH